VTLRRVNQREFRTAVKAQLEGLSIMAGKTPEPYQTHIPQKRGPRQPSAERRERNVNDEIREWQAKEPDITLWRNNRGEIQLDGGARLRYGIGPNGASDFIGYVSVTVTQAMVGKRVAIFCAVESKRPRGEPTDDQITFIDRIKAAGGRAGVARSAADAELIVA